MKWQRQTLLLANAAMNNKKREISIYFRVSSGLDTFWTTLGKGRGPSAAARTGSLSMSYNSLGHSRVTQIDRCLMKANYI